MDRACGRFPPRREIQAVLREQIVGMQVPPGAAVSEKDIAEAYGVSRTPVREAILRLSEERLVDFLRSTAPSFHGSALKRSRTPW